MEKGAGMLFLRLGVDQSLNLIEENSRGSLRPGQQETTALPLLPAVAQVRLLQRTQGTKAHGKSRL